MNRYNNYTVENFATDEMFRKWVLCPTPEISSFWKRWLGENPEKKGILNQARELVMAVNESFRDTISQEKIDAEIAQIVRLAEKSKRPETNSTISFNVIVWRVAAVFLLTSCLAWLFYARQIDTKPLLTKEVKAKLSEKLLVRTNDSASDITVLLSDNSVATLMKGSTLTYPAMFEGNERKVALSGEAFFDISKNPEKPFLVFANETVTKVLGTSFRVRAFEKDNTVTVVVKTGKVSVYQMNEYENASLLNDTKTAGVILNSNQQVVFIKNQNRLQKGVVSNPEMLSESSVSRELIFEDKPVTEVLQTLENMYGIVIRYDQEIMSNCVISAQFDEENLRQKMNAICQAIGASYEMVDGQIVISSNGCS